MEPTNGLIRSQKRKNKVTMSGTRRSRKQPTVISKQRKSTTTPRVQSDAVKKYLKDQKLWKAAEVERKKKLVAEKKRKELARKRAALMTAAKKKGVKLRTDYTALYRNKG
jgi:TorA maturation chaperone TorD